MRDRGSDHVQGPLAGTVPLDIIDRVRSAYEGRRVLVTGGMSFIGSHLVEALVASGAHVVVADDLSSGREKYLLHLQDDFQFLPGDLRAQTSPPGPARTQK